MPSKVKKIPKLTKVYTVTYHHKHGTDVSVADSEDGARRMGAQLAYDRSTEDEPWTDEDRAKAALLDDADDAGMLDLFREVEDQFFNGESIEITETTLGVSASPSAITIVHGSQEWDALIEALDQYTDNQRNYLENHCEPDDEKRGKTNLEFAQKIMDKINAVYAAMAE